MCARDHGLILTRYQESEPFLLLFVLMFFRQNDKTDEVQFCSWCLVVLQGRTASIPQ